MDLDFSPGWAKSRSCLHYFFLLLALRGGYPYEWMKLEDPSFSLISSPVRQRAFFHTAVVKDKDQPSDSG